MSMEFQATPLFRNLAIAFLAFSFFQCSDDEPDNSALINCDLSLFSNAAMQGKITINQASLNLEQIEVTGTQPSLSIISFSRTIPADESRVDLLSNGNSIIRLDAAQNDYDPLSLTLTPAGDSYSLDVQATENGQTVNIDDYLGSAAPSLLLSGRFDNRGKSIPIHVAFPEVMPLKSIAEQYGSIRVKLDLENLAEIQINSGYLFDGVTTQQLETASKAIHQNQEVIFIHPAFNSGLYDIFLARLEDAQNSMKVKVKVTRSATDQ